MDALMVHEFLIFRYNKPQGLVRLKGLGKFKKSLLWLSNRDFPVCSTVP
jgi:hypothetical protein